ncbi:helix-turn-helix domain-containing protein [Bifidobacterium xylocopae]|uniref:Helix-turn-helix domain-containing protein n=1 Tax=Bifidobacterium xylocopae TaxID=2493119 RepID=A0A366KBQ0_9BIFI|nr:helix-turn-helix domain-containing protein [Bifidobacterium xylocopae]RBP98797.1 hypothetical protein CRD59_07210 [Bifidobacterium xylocopae]
MSVQARAWAQRCHVGNPAAKSVLCYLADRASDDGTGAWPKVRTICEVTEFKERTVQNALKLLEEQGFIRPGDQRHAALLPHGRTRPKQYRARVWDLCMERDPGVSAYLKRTHKDETAEPPAGVDQTRRTNACTFPVDGTQQASRGAADAPLVVTGADGRGQGRISCASRGAADAPLYKPSGINRQINPLVPMGHSPTGDRAPDDGAKELLKGFCDLLAELGLPVPGDVSRPSRRELSAAESLARQHGSTEALALARWALTTSDGFWRPTIRSCRQLAKHWPTLALQRARDAPDTQSSAAAPEDDDRPTLVSGDWVLREPVYGYRRLGLEAARAHLNGEMPAEECPYCRLDERNREHHPGPDVVLERRRRQAAEEAQKNEKLKQAQKKFRAHRRVAGPEIAKKGA